VAIQKLTIEDFLKLAKEYPVLDVRSPGEYHHAHIPGAYSLPLFTDEERKVVGTAYKQQSREAAIKIGLDYFGVKMKKMVEEVEKLVCGLTFVVNENEPSEGREINHKPQTTKTILVHCWRGGMRSAGVAWLLDLYGFKVYTLVGGYKAYRKWVLAQFEKQYHFHIIGGFTGSGKTEVLRALPREANTVVDLEALASHKGSAFGAIEGQPQPKQEMFENLLAQALSEATSHIPNPESCIWLEDESQRIGNLQIPISLWHTMRNSPVYYLDIPFEERLAYITEEYGKLPAQKLEDAILRIQKRLGGLEARNALDHLREGKLTDCFRILLTYYDKWYQKGLHNRENLASLLNKIPCAGVDTKINVQNLLACKTISA